MATTTLATVAEGVASKVGAACAGPGCGIPGATIKAFTATAGTGNYPILGLTLDLSDLFPNKVLAVIVSPLYDPALASADLGFLAVYVPDSDGDPAAGKVYAYAATGIMTADDTVAITGYVVTGFAIGY